MASDVTGEGHGGNRQGTDIRSLHSACDKGQEAYAIKQHDGQKGHRFGFCYVQEGNQYGDEEVNELNHEATTKTNETMT